MTVISVGRNRAQGLLGAGQEEHGAHLGQLEPNGGIVEAEAAGLVEEPFVEADRCVEVTRVEVDPGECSERLHPISKAARRAGWISAADFMLAILLCRSTMSII
jgi:hypothetical protein